MNYSQYYDLESYLFGEVSKKFSDTGNISVSDFFCIVIWKANRSKTKIKKKLLKYGSLGEAVKALSEDIYQTKESQDKFSILVKKWGFGLPMASAILTVLYLDIFTVYDYRVTEQLGLKKIYTVKRYFDYFLPKVKEYTEKQNIKLRDADKELWGKSFYEDLMKLIR